jgi:hypothetical protein
VLREAARIVNLEEYEVLLTSSLREAQNHVDWALGLLRLEADAQALEDGLYDVNEAMRKAGEDVACADSPESKEGPEDTWPRFLHCAAWAGALRKARTIMLLLNERRQSECSSVDQKSVDDFASVVHELREQFDSSLRPAWELYARFLSWRRRLQHAREEWYQKQQGLQEVPTILKDLLAAAHETLCETFTALQAAKDEKDAEVSLSKLQQVISAVEAAADSEKEKLRVRQEASLRLKDEKAWAERTREEEAKAKACEEAAAQMKLERLDRRRVYLQESLRIEEAWEVLRAARAIGQVPAEPREKESGVEAEPDGGLCVTGVEGSKAVVVPPAPVQDRERWIMAKTDAEPPLNLAWQSALPNRVSKDFWDQCRQRRDEEKSGNKFATRYRLRGKAIDPTQRRVGTNQRRKNDPSSVLSHITDTKRRKRQSAEGEQRFQTSQMRSVVEVVGLSSDD